MKIGKLSAVLAVCCLFLTTAYADAQTVDKSKTGTAQITNYVSIELYGGYLKGQSRELVYNAQTGHKESELFWRIDEAFVVGGTIAVRPVDWLTFKVGGWIPVKSNNTMEDYDWSASGKSDWSDWSNHPDTQMTRAHTINAGAAVRVAKFDKTSLFDRAQLDLLAGYRWFYIGWTAYNGSFIYSRDSGWHNDIDSNPEGHPVIAYEQWIETPYLGIGGSMSINRWSFNGEVTGSLWGRASDRDHHFNRTLLFEEEYNNMSMLAGEFSASYAFTDHFSLFGSFVFQKFFEVQSSTTKTNYETGEVTNYPGNAAGMDHYSMLLNLGIKCVF